MQPLMKAELSLREKKIPKGLPSFEHLDLYISKARLIILLVIIVHVFAARFLTDTY